MALATKLHQMGANFPRVDYVRDPTSGLWLPGFILEPERINKLLYSDTHDNGAWTKRGACTATPDTAISPTGAQNANTIANVGVYSTDDMYQSVAGAGAASAPVAVAQWIKRISTSGTLRIQNSSAAPDYGEWDVNLANLPDEWVRLDRSSPYVSVVSEFKIAPSTNCGMHFFRQAGASPLSFYLWNSQLVVVADRVATSDIVTGSGAVTRTTDSAAAWATYVPDGFTLNFALNSNCAFTPTTDQWLVTVDDGTADNAVRIAWEANTGKLKVYCMVGGVLKRYITISEAWALLTDGKHHWGTIRYSRGELAVGVDGHAKQATAGTLGHVPGMNRIALWPSGCPISVQFQNRWLTGEPTPVQPVFLRE